MPEHFRDKRVAGKKNRTSLRRLLSLGSALPLFLFAFSSGYQALATADTVPSQSAELGQHTPVMDALENRQDSHREAVDPNRDLEDPLGVVEDFDDPIGTPPPEPTFWLEGYTREYSCSIGRRPGEATCDIWGNRRDEPRPDPQDPDITLTVSGEYRVRERLRYTAGHWTSISYDGRLAETERRTKDEQITGPPGHDLAIPSQWISRLNQTDTFLYRLYQPDLSLLPPAHERGLLQHDHRKDLYEFDSTGWDLAIASRGDSLDHEKRVTENWRKTFGFHTGAELSMRGREETSETYTRWAVLQADFRTRRVHRANLMVSRNRWVNVYAGPLIPVTHRVSYEQIDYERFRLSSQWVRNEFREEVRYRNHEGDLQETSLTERLEERTRVGNRFYLTHESGNETQWVYNGCRLVLPCVTREKSYENFYSVIANENRNYLSSSSVSNRVWNRSQLESSYSRTQQFYENGDPKWLRVRSESGGSTKALTIHWPRPGFFIFSHVGITVWLRDANGDEFIEGTGASDDRQRILRLFRLFRRLENPFPREFRRLTGEQDI